LTSAENASGTQIRPSVPRTALADRVEWPTIAISVGVYGLFGVLTWFHAVLPWWLLVLAGGYIVALHGSLQHEVVHGHPTPKPWVNEALVFPSLWLWLPFRIYRDSHLQHHRAAVLTDPADDPESFYVDSETWARLPGIARAALVAHNTLLGRLVIGPPLAVVRFLIGEAGNQHWTRDRAIAWLLHMGGVGLVVTWTWGVCGIPLAEYLLVFVYPGVALTLLRSFAEHDAHPDPTRRTTVVEAEAPLALAFLNNNLHVVHHRYPHLPWYRLPDVYRLDRRTFLAAGGTVYDGYFRLAVRYLVIPRRSPRFPAVAI